MTSIIHLTAPADPTGTPNQLVHGVVEIMREESRALVGTPDLTDPPEALLKGLADPGPHIKVWLVALDGDAPDDVPVGPLGYVEVPADVDTWPKARVLGVCPVFMPLLEEVHTFNGEVTVAEEGNGVRELLIAAADEIGTAAGRTVASFSSWHRSPAGDASDVPAANEGSVPRDASSDALLAAGYRLVQVERNSMLDLPPEESVLLSCEERGAAAVDYDVEFLAPPFADEDRPRIMHLFSRMDVEAPHEGMDVEESVWDDERFDGWVRRRFSEHMTCLMAVGRHRGTRELAGFSCILVPLGDYDVVFQGSTLVLADHRGKGLGWALKAAALRELAVRYPERTLVSTWNAANNPWMLAINVHLGFALRSVSGVWRKDF